MKPQENNNTTKAKKGNKKWCEFHKSPTHITNKCYAKKSLVAELKGSELDECSKFEPRIDKGKKIIDAEPSAITVTANFKEIEPKYLEEGEHLIHS